MLPSKHGTTMLLQVARSVHNTVSCVLQPDHRMKDDNNSVAKYDNGDCIKNNDVNLPRFCTLISSVDP